MSASDIDGVLRERFGFTSFREGQREIIETLIGGRDLVAVMPTGGGKSLCYQLPAVVLPGVTLVVSPLIALMKDQVDALTSRGIAARYVNSTLSAAEQASCIQMATRGELELLYVAPERFRSRRFMAAVAEMKVSLFAVDEAHCLSQWGHDFRPDYLKLDEAIAQAGRPPVAAFTATATPDVRADIAASLGLREPLTFFSGIDRPNLFLSVNFCATRRDKLAAIVEASSRWGGGSGIVYASTRKNVDLVWAHVRGEGVPAVRYHAGLDQEERRVAQDAFMSGERPLIVATNAFGMGVDKADIRYVMHFDFPGSLEAYYQEVGRAGRDGEPSECQLLFNYADLRIQEFFIDGSNPPRAVIEEVYQVLAAEEDELIELTTSELTRRLRSTDNDFAVGTAVKILDRYGALDRDRSGSHAFIQVFEPLEALQERVARAPVQAKALDALIAAHGLALMGGADVDPARVASRAGLEREQLIRALGEMHKAGILEYVPPFRGRAIRVGSGRGLSRVDWEHLAEKDRRDRQRVQDVIRFAYGSLCRKAALRSYFAVEGGHAGGCGSCDVCFGVRAPAGRKRGREASRGGSVAPSRARDIRGEELEVVRKILACAARMKGRFGRSRVAQVLQGSSNQDVKRAGLDRLSTYGILGEYRQKDLQILIDALIGAGLLQQRLLEDGPVGGAAVVEVSPSGWEVMTGRQELHAAIPRIKGRGVEITREAEPSSGAPLGQGGGAWQEDGAAGDDLFEALRAWRRARASADGVPPYVVLHDRVLKQLVRYAPTSPEELSGIKGMGPRKIATYGAELVALILEHRRLPETESS